MKRRTPSPQSESTPTTLTPWGEVQGPAAALLLRATTPEFQALMDWIGSVERWAIGEITNGGLPCKGCPLVKREDWWK